MCILKSSGAVGQILQASGNGKKKAVIQILTMDKEWIKKQKQKTYLQREMVYLVKTSSFRCTQCRKGSQVLMQERNVKSCNMIDRPPINSSLEDSWLLGKILLIVEKMPS